MYPRNKTQIFLNDIIEENSLEDESSVEISQKEKSDNKLLLSTNRINKTLREEEED